LQISVCRREKKDGRLKYFTLKNEKIKIKKTTILCRDNKFARLKRLTKKKQNITAHVGKQNGLEMLWILKYQSLSNKKRDN